IDIVENIEQRQVKISITDTGYGICEKKVNLVFEPFNRLGAEASNIEGTGIGLVITKKIIEMMGGKIGFDSVVDKGSVFWVKLPISDG
ncbi:MAG: hybrid sensor histidine kinase/response regulator, partial [Methylococcaceae bacterium]|nr:hybrid sensor histidine kinase/response regulator [Methylococcaceae bacterium]